MFFPNPNALGIYTTLEEYFRMSSQAYIHRTELARVAIFVDAANVYKSTERNYPAGHINYRKILAKLLGKRTLHSAQFFDVSLEDDSKNAFFEVMHNIGFQVITKPLKAHSGGVMKGNCDLDLAIAAVRTASRIDVAILVGGDGDYIPLVQYLHEQGVRVEGASFLRDTDLKLHAMFDSFVDFGSAECADIFTKRENRAS